MSEFFTSDTHFGHGAILEYCQRPFADLAEMNRVMTERWNARVKPDDTVYHLGDFAMGPKALLPMFRKALNGRIVIIRGNHDRSTGALTVAGFDEVHSELYLDRDGVALYLHHQPMPPAHWVSKAAIHLHGHVHNEWVSNGPLINVGVDVRNFEPKLLEELVDDGPVNHGG